jgi:hypothetical protein
MRVGNPKLHKYTVEIVQGVAKTDISGRDLAGMLIEEKENHIEIDLSACDDGIENSNERRAAQSIAEIVLGDTATLRIRDAKGSVVFGTEVANPKMATKSVSHATNEGSKLYCHGILFKIPKIDI